MSVVRRPWHLLNVDTLRAGLSAPRLCQPDSWIDCSIDQLAELYTRELTSLLDQLSQRRLLPFGGAHLIPGSTRNVDRQSVPFVGWKS